MRRIGTVGQGAARPDEDVFVMPPAWRAKAHPRRGGRVKDVVLRPDALEVVRALVADPRGEALIAHERTAPAIVDAVARYRTGVADPLGAAASVIAVSRDTAAHPVVTEAWIQEHGLAFAAAAVLEMADLAAVHAFGAGGEWLVAGERDLRDLYCSKANVTAPVRLLRDLLASCDDTAYADTVAALAPLRNHRRIVLVSYLLPDQADWLDESVRFSAFDLDIRRLDYLAHCITRPEHLTWLSGVLSLNAYAGMAEQVASLAEVFGSDIDELLVRQLATARQEATKTRKATFAALSWLPTDKAFGALLDHIGDSRAWTSITAAAKRFPLRALRMLAARADDGPDTDLTLGFLAAHIAANSDLLGDVLPELSPEIAAIVRPLADAFGGPARAFADLTPVQLSEFLTVLSELTRE